MLESIYIFSFVVGGGFVLISSFFGGGDGDLDGDVEGDAGEAEKGELSKEVSASPDMDTATTQRFRPLRSFKFWTFFLAFFGLTGLVLSKLGVLALPSFLCALVMGGAFGFLVAWALHRLSTGQTSSHLGAEQLVGKEAEVLVAVRGYTPGTVRLLHGDRPVEMLAISDSEDRMERGQKVVVTAVIGQKIKVVPYV